VSFSTGSASASAFLGVSSLTVVTPGVYSVAPAVALSAPASGTAATAQAALGGLVATAGDLTIQAVGDMPVQNPNYTGPSGLGAPYNTKTIIRHYGFGPQCVGPVSGCTAPFNAAVSSVTVGGVPATITGWSDTQITVSMPANVPGCPLLQSTSTLTKLTTIPQQCGEVVITSGNGKQSITGITVTIGGKTPQLITTASPSSASFGEFYTNPIQTAIDSAATAPGDLLIVDAGSYRENVIMWKPLRLQGVGAGAVTINADAQPAGKMDAWRRRVDCLFGLQLNGWTNSNNSQFNADGESYTCPANMYFRADRLPFEGFVGWDASSNGNLAQVLQEPSLMGAYEGAGVTVVARGIRQPNATDLWGMGGGAGTYVDGSVYLTDKPSDCGTATTSLPTTLSGAGDYGTGNFQCNPSGIDGLTITNSSQGGGGVYLHGFNNNFEIANSRIVANAGTLSGGINIGNGESPPVSVNDGTICGPGIAAPAPLCPPTGNNSELGIAMPKTNAVIPSQLQPFVHVHHNQVIDNASIGDALFSGSPAGAGGITISAGSDDYEIDHNWVAGNLTSSDGGGIAHMGVSFNGSIHNNWVLFNEANNPTLSVDGGGIIVMGAQEDRTLITTQQECGGTTDTDCPPGIGDGTGPGLVIDSNLILGNSAAYGSGGGLRLRQTNGTEVANFPNTANADWYSIAVTNNIIVNNVAGWDGGGVSLQDSFKTSLINNTIAANDTTASAGVLFKTLGAINEASPAPGCVPTPDPSQPQAVGCLNPNAPHIPQPAGLVTMQNTPNMMASLNGFISPEAVVTKTTTTGGKQGVTCPSGFGYGNGTNFGADSAASLVDGRCVLVSLPKLVNNLFWQNRAFHVEMVNAQGVPLGNQGNTTPNGTGLQSQQNIIALLPTFTQTATGQCVDPVGLKNTDGSALQLYWDLGVRMDTLPDANGHALFFNNATVGSGFSLEAVLAATIRAGSVNGVTISANGGFYTSAPTVTVTGGGPGMNASITGNTLTVQAVSAGAGAASSTASTGAAAGTTVTIGGTINGVFAVGQTLSGTGIASGATIDAIDTTGTVLTVSLANTGAVSGAVEAYAPAPAITVGQPVAGLGVTPGTIITGVGTGTGAEGTYTVNNAQTVLLEPMTYNVTPATIALTVDLVTTSPTYGQVTAARVTSGGSGYTSIPSVTLTGGGLTVNTLDASSSAGIGLQAVNSIFSDNVNLLNLANAGATGNGNLTTAANDSTANADASGLLVGHYCNGARIPPEQCGSQQGANNSGMCLGYFTPAGISENVGVPQVFRFANIAATATVDEGNNWINMTYGPLTLSRPTNTEDTTTVAGATPTATEQILTVGTVGGRAGAYSLPLGSAAIDAGAPVALANDFYGNPRTSGAAPDIGAVEFPSIGVDLSITKAASATSVASGSTFSYTITVTNAAASGNAVAGALVADTAPAGITFNSWTCAISGAGAGDACGASSGTGSIATTVSLAAGDSATFTINATAGGAGTVTNFASVTAPKGYKDTNTANNSASAAVTVLVPAPVLTAISPANALPGANFFTPDNVVLTLTGQNLTGASAVSVSGSGMSCTAGTIAVNAGGTSLTVTCPITSAAALGNRSVTVTTPGGTSGAETFLVGAPGFSLSGTNPLVVIGFGNPTTTATLTNTNSVSETIGTILAVKNSGTGTFGTTAGGSCKSGLVLASGATCTIVVQLSGHTGLNASTGTLTVSGTATATSQAVPTLTRSLSGL
jgi:uncharacterized repeat protein (TIGR01451 family)